MSYEPLNSPIPRTQSLSDLLQSLQEVAQTPESRQSGSEALSKNRRRKTDDLLSPGEEVVFSFFDLDSAGLAISQCDFSQSELISTIISQIRNSPPKDKSKYIVLFMGLLKELATLNGRVTTARLERSTNGEESTTRIESSQSFLSRLVPPAPMPAPLARHLVSPDRAQPSGDPPPGDPPYPPAHDAQ